MGYLEANYHNKQTILTINFLHRKISAIDFSYIIFKNDYMQINKILKKSKLFLIQKLYFTTN